MEVGKLEFDDKRCYSFEDFKALENRVRVLEDVVKEQNEILMSYIDCEMKNENRKN